MTQAFCCLLLLALGSAGQALAQVSDAENKLMVLEHVWNEAQVNRDAPVLDALVAETFTNTEYDGEVSDKAKFLADIKDPQFKPASMNVQGMKVTFYRTTAVVIGEYRTKGSYQGKTYDHVGRFTDTWVFQGDKWVCVASHSSLLKK
jgi:hypothetical protein